jgi:hypothetical protein
MSEVQLRSRIVSVFSYPRFRTTFRSHIQGLTSMNMGIIRPTSMAAAKYPATHKVLDLLCEFVSILNLSIAIYASWNTTVWNSGNR